MGNETIDEMMGIKEYDSRQAANRLEDGSSILLDVRTIQERNRDHIKGSLHIPLHDLPTQLDSLEKYRLKEIICYCQSGRRSLIAAMILQQHDFQAVNMRGGMIEWNKLKYEIVNKINR